MSLPDDVARNLHSAREAKKLSQVALAKKAKISVSYMSMLERGLRVPPLDTLEALAKGLGEKSHRRYPPPRRSSPAASPAPHSGQLKVPLADSPQPGPSDAWVFECRSDARSSCGHTHVSSAWLLHHAS